ncbi:disulfide bond formation protein B [Nostoc ellipsosporum NOK]|uniref:disulfide bond formation protein B n=1 Tax=Sphingomonas sp. IBVSS2 TaxID=1985172 RepID=UPI000A2D1042|nr:disulfide bond formation protein B [Sphingomonas sp. IBVSS2]MDF2381891.1 disulfide bond formation protein B [Nostoc ellipsosporum NOK]OSZ69867.1 disulfide bond formation protein B [Sphingomonas sp. IBVSS2]
MRNDGLRIARWIALLLPLALVGGAHLSELFGLVPCEMCWWQRWPHYAAVLIALSSFLVKDRRAQLGLVLLAGTAVAISGGIGVFHAGVEYKWWQGITACTAQVHGGSPMDMLNDALRRPLIRCDVPQWTLFGISLAGFNAILSLGGAILIFLLATRRGTRA